jgi:hypothetical protein
VNGLGLAAFLFSTFGLLCASIPGMALVAMPLVGAGLVLGLLGVVTRSARTGGKALPLAGLAVSVPVLLVAGVWPGMLDLRSHAARQREDANKETVFHLAELGVARREVPKETEWVDASKDALQHGGVRVRVDSVAVKSAELKDTKGKSHASDRSLVIRLRISNVSFDHLVEYTSWGRAGSADQVSLPDLKDNLGRSYTMRTFAPGWTVAGQVRRATIPGAKWVDDILVFEPPPARIEYLRLELPAPAVGAKGTFKLEIPRRMIRFP